MLALAACSGEVVGGGQRDVDTYATADGGSPASPARLPAGRLSPGGFGTYHAQLLTAQGTVSFDARFSLLATAGGATRLTDETETVVVDLPGGDSVRVSREAVPDLQYSHVRIEFVRAAAHVTGGLVLGGAPFTGTLAVDIRDAPLVVDVPITLEEGGGDVTLVVDLDASSWILAGDRVTGTVPSAAFAAAVKARVH
jgi:hypothetical protein